MPVAGGKRKWPTSNTQDVENFTSYVAEICGEFISMAETAQLPMLAYLLGMARDEATRVASAAHKADRTPEP